MEIKLIRIGESQEATIGEIYVNGELKFYSIEDKWKDNERNVSCIPVGTYLAKYTPASPSGKYKDIYTLQDVQDRTGILIHAGNTAEDTKGCILPATYIVLEVDKADRGVVSRNALKILHEITGRKDFTLKIEYKEI